MRGPRLRMTIACTNEKLHLPFAGREGSGQEEARRIVEEEEEDKGRGEELLSRALACDRPISIVLASSEQRLAPGGVPTALPPCLVGIANRCYLAAAASPISL